MSEIRIINLPKISDKRGSLSFFENCAQIPFEIKRTYWVYDTPEEKFRGGYACKTADEFIVALSGSFDAMFDNGVKKSIFSLNRSYYGLYIPCMTWLEMQNFSTNSLALIVSSVGYDAGDCICDYDEFLILKGVK
ncbi:MAG: FdtA/QdtA family cupin domain-containing protein [Treponema sp.]|jgi:hypothetical protein|nr:FdtA/QdtA family cupin domain-containing protein [Treponema sp.]